MNTVNLQSLHMVTGERLCTLLEAEADLVSMSACSDSRFEVYNRCITGGSQAPGRREASHEGTWGWIMTNSAGPCERRIAWQKKGRHDEAVEEWHWMEESRGDRWRERVKMRGRQLAPG